MSDPEKDELIDAQKQVIGILFEIVKRLQANCNLDTEYLQAVSGPERGRDKARLERIMSERKENAEIVGRLLEQLDVR